MINDISIVRIEQSANGGVGGAVSGVISGIPLGGQEGQVLAKASSSNYDLEWADREIGLPIGGANGQILIKNSNNDYDVVWESLASNLSTETLVQTAYNDSGSTIQKGSVVYVVGADGSFPKVSKASVATEHDANVLGIAAENILNDTYGLIIIEGILDGVNTNDFLIGEKLYLSFETDGEVTNIQPSSPNHQISIGYCVNKSIDGSIYVKIDNGSHLDRLHDVSIASPAAKQALFYSESGIWVNKRIEIEDISNLSETFYQSTNPSGFITGIDTSNFYTNDNPSGFITGLQDLIYTTGDQFVSGKLTSLFSDGDVQIPLGFSNYAYIRNLGSDLYKGDVVYVAGAQGDRAAVLKASNTGELTSSKTFGIAAHSIVSGSDGYIITNGNLQNLNILNSFAAGDSLWLGSVDGSITNIKPQAPAHSVFLGVVEKPGNGNNGIMYVKIQNGVEIDELHDVLIQNPVSGQFLVRDSSLDVWRNKSVMPSDIGAVSSGEYKLLVDAVSNDLAQITQQLPINEPTEGQVVTYIGGQRLWSNIGDTVAISDLDKMFNSARVNYYHEMIYNASGDISIIDVYTDETKNTQLYSRIFMYDEIGNIIQITTTDQQNPEIFLAKIISYNEEGDITSINRNYNL